MGARLCVSNWRRTPDNAIPSRAKINGSYVNAALMKHEAVLSGFDDAISLDGQGHVAEATVANIFLVRGGYLITPSGSTDLLEGITRDSVFQLAKQLNGIAVQKGNFLGLAEGEPVAQGTSFDEVARAVIDKLLAEPRGVMTLLTGADEPDVQSLVALLEQQHPGLEFEVHPGGQPLYPLLLSAE